MLKTSNCKAFPFFVLQINRPTATALEQAFRKKAATSFLRLRGALEHGPWCGN